MDIPDYQAIAEFRYQIRRFIRFSETAARKQGLNGQQHQLLLAIKGFPDGARPTIVALAERMQLRHHSTGELLNRLSENGYVVRVTDPDDRRQVHLRITRKGDAVLKRLTLIHTNELKTASVRLLKTLQNITHDKTRTQ